MLPNEIDLDGLKAELKAGKRVILQVRHAERPKMAPDDPSFGDQLAITAEGCRTARKLGEELKEFAAVADFVASPLKRTMMTAELIAEGMGLGGKEIKAYGCLGNESFYYKDTSQVLEVFQVANFFPACKKYMETGTLPGFHPLYEASENLDQWLKGQLKKQFLIAATHDLYIAAFLSAMTVAPRKGISTIPAS